MELADAATLSDRIGVQPVFVEAADMSYCRRPRLYWLKNMAVKAMDDFELSDRIVHGGRDGIVKVCMKPALDRFLEPGVEAARPDELPFLTFTRPENRSGPRYKPTGIDRCSEEALRRWERDYYRVAPYQYEAKNLVRDARGQLRRPSADEQARMLGSPPTYWTPSRRCSGRQTWRTRKGC